MHRVDRGPEPDRLEEIRISYTPRWVQYYCHRDGRQPTDSRWRDFCCEMRHAFRSLCAYCEQICQGEIDHFRPKRRFPMAVYEWTNWVFACRDCNHAKGDKWPAPGLVNPCTDCVQEFPERYFRFDTLTGEILPAKGLTERRRARALTTITELKLNGRHHLKRRKRFLWFLWSYECRIGLAIPRDVLSTLMSRDAEFSSLARTWAVERGYASLKVLEPLHP